MSWYSDAASMLKDQRAARLKRKSDILYTKAMNILERSERMWSRARDMGAFDKQIIG